jgi:hypothetical protein
MSTDHVVMHTGTHKFECKHCGATYQPTLPAPINMFAAMAKVFSLQHKNCTFKEQV